MKEKQPHTSRMVDLMGQLANPVAETLEEVASRLKQKGLRPVKSPKFNYNIVLSIYYGRYEDTNNYVELELIQLIAEKNGLEDKAKPHLDALRQLVGVE